MIEYENQDRLKSQELLRAKEMSEVSVKKLEAAMSEVQTLQA